MAKTATATPLSSESSSPTQASKARKPRPLRAPAAPLPPAPASASDSTQLSTVKPLLIGVGIGATLMGAAVVLHSRSEKSTQLSPFHGPNSALASALTKSALFALARMVSGQTVRSVATRALLEVAEAWKA
jgi:hypothetical protein